MSCVYFFNVILPLYTRLNMRAIIFILCTSITTAAVGQNPQKANKVTKKTVQINEIDRLYGKYKNSDSLTISNEFGTFKAKIVIGKLPDGRPYEISVVGNISDRLEPALDEFIKSIVIDRRKKGYNSEHSLQNQSVEDELYNADMSKGILYLSDRYATDIRVTKGGIIDTTRNSYHGYIIFLIANSDYKRVPEKSKVDF